MSEQLWEERLDEAAIRLEPEVRVDVCAKRYDVDDRHSIKRLTNAALQEAINAGFGSIALEDLDAAAERLEVTA